MLLLLYLTLVLSAYGMTSDCSADIKNTYKLCDNPNDVFCPKQIYLTHISCCGPNQYNTPAYYLYQKQVYDQKEKDWAVPTCSDAGWDIAINLTKTVLENLAFQSGQL